MGANFGLDGSLTRQREILSEMPRKNETANGAADTAASTADSTWLTATSA